MTAERILAFRDLVYSGSPQVAAREEGRENTSPSTLPSPFDQHCIDCRRLLQIGETFADGFTDNPLLCHSCQARDARHYEAFLERIGKHTGWDRESTEGRNGQ